MINFEQYWKIDSKLYLLEALGGLFSRDLTGFEKKCLKILQKIF